MGLLDLIFLDLRAWVPGVECAGFSSYTALLLWTIMPIFLYIMALIAAAGRVVSRSRWNVTEDEGNGDQTAQRKQQLVQFADIKASLTGVTELALGLVSLIHTLICVRIFQMFDCTTVNYGEERGGTINGHGKRSILAVDYSLDCRSNEHKRFKVYAYLMAFFYVIVMVGLEVQL